jgi:hypothetical protein
MKIDSMVAELKENDTLCWTNSRNYQYNWHAEDEISETLVFFGFTVSNNAPERTSLTDLLYLMRLSQYENEHSAKVGKLKLLSK